jgi:hypothetical protein
LNDLGQIVVAAGPVGAPLGGGGRVHGHRLLLDWDVTVIGPRADTLEDFCPGDWLSGDGDR